MISSVVMSRASSAVAHPRAIVLVLLCAFAAIYAPAVGHGFIKDDFEWIEDSRIASVGDAFRFLQRAPSGFFRPAVSLTFAADYAACGFNSKCYGLTNVALALACAGSVFLLSRALLLSNVGSVVASAVWLFNWHGINMAVLWISGRTALLVVAFATSAAAAYISKRFVLGSFLLLAALLSKEEAVLLPVVLIAWALYDSRLTASLPTAARIKLIVSAVLVETAYFVLRAKSGAFTPATAPSFYRFTFAPTAVASNLFQYLDRTATFAVMVVMLWILISRTTKLLLTVEDKSVIAFGILWWIGTLGLTVFLPVRSSLYACLPSVGVALIAGSMVSRSVALSPVVLSQRLSASILLPFLLSPVYYLRAQPLTREADLSRHTLETLRHVANRLPAGASVLLHDDVSAKPRLVNPFGNFIQKASTLIVSPHLLVWIDPPPEEARPDEPKVPTIVDVEFNLTDGRLIQTRP